MWASGIRCSSIVFGFRCLRSISVMSEMFAQLIVARASPTSMSRSVEWRKPQRARQRRRMMADWDKERDRAVTSFGFGFGFGFTFTCANRPRTLGSEAELKLIWRLPLQRRGSSACRLPHAGSMEATTLGAGVSSMSGGKPNGLSSNRIRHELTLSLSLPRALSLPLSLSIFLCISLFATWFVWILSARRFRILTDQILGSSIGSSLQQFAKSSHARTRERAAERGQHKQPWHSNLVLPPLATRLPSAARLLQQRRRSSTQMECAAKGFPLHAGDDAAEQLGAGASQLRHRLRVPHHVSSS